MTTISLPAVKKVALYQLALLLPASAALLGWSRVTAYSVLLGGLIQILPQAWFARQAFRFAGARRVQSIVSAMYWGETGKVVLSAVLFTATFLMVSPLYIGALFSGFVLMILVQWFWVFKILKPEAQVK
ncbi:F0F1 ATP synthase subunit I [Gammaproteobacteria bacterium MOLA455]|nr:F0F1 ATP synthase subunit I [Gammaproteobacteria bacterium MOLA455]